MDHEINPAPVEPTPAVAAVEPLDLAAIAADLADVEVALARLEAGSYFTDEVTGEPLPADFLAAHPTARTRQSA
jgi:RNA polymerase-binding transcription factor DksA